MTTEIDLHAATKHGTNYDDVWGELASDVFRVLDEDGNNIADCRVRHLIGRHWLCADDVDGYTILEESAVRRLILSAE